MSDFFTIYPAIDLREGKVVRLKFGDPRQQTVFGEDPSATAQRWASAGARWLHVVNLDGAFNEAGAANWEALSQLTGVGPRVQFGGGVRTLIDVERALEAGAARVIVGTVAVENPALLAEIIATVGSSRVVVALDAWNGIVKTRGWQTDSGINVVELGRKIKAIGVSMVLHTDIGRDGVLRGVNAQASAALARETDLEVIASGGVASLADIEQALRFAQQGVTGVITGRALYEGHLDLAEALEMVETAARNQERIQSSVEEQGE